MRACDAQQPRLFVETAADVDCAAGIAFDARPASCVLTAPLSEQSTTGSCRWPTSVLLAGCRCGYSCTRSVKRTTTPANAAGRRGNGALFRTRWVV
jgi:hypothetical protein